MARMTKAPQKASPLYARVRQILESARASVARSVNTTQVVANWLIGREIVEVDSKFEAARQISDAPPRKSMLTTPRDALPPIRHAVRSELGGAQTLKILYALRRGSLRLDGGASGTTDGRAGYGR